jgi:hypothetical protein
LGEDTARLIRRGFKRFSILRTVVGGEKEEYPHHTHSDPEDGGNMFLRFVSIYIHDIKLKGAKL